jgi:hypothetical protein
VPFLKKSDDKKKKPFEASMPIDNPDVKVVTASYKGNPFFFGVGTSTQREVKGSGQANLKEGVKGEYQSQKDLKWDVFYNLGALPSGFVPAEKVKDFMASTVAVTSGSVAVYQPVTEYRETSSRKLKGIENRLAMIRSATELRKLMNERNLEVHHKVPLKKGGKSKANHQE